MSIQDISNLLHNANILAHLSEQPQVQLSLQPTSTSSQNIRKAPWSNEHTREEEAVNQAPEHDISDDDQDQDQTDGENEERYVFHYYLILLHIITCTRCMDGVQDQEKTLETGDTTDFGQHEDDLDGEYEGEAQEDLNRCDFDHEPDAVDDFLDQGIDGDFDDELDTQRDKPDAQDNAIDDDFNDELDNTARDKTEESVLIFVLSHSKSPRRPSPQHVVSTGSSALALPLKYSCRNKRKAKTAQEDPVKLGFYPPAWQAFLQAEKLEMHLQAVLMHPIPDHQDALQLAQEVLDAELWMYHEKKIKLDNVHDTNVVTELKKIVISIAKASYNIFPKGTIARKDEVQRCVIAKATKLLKTSDYLCIPDSSNGKWKNFVSQALRDGCLEFYYGNSKKALKNTDEFRHTIPINGLLLVGAVVKGVLTGFRKTGTDKVPDLSADKCRADFNSLQRSVDALLENPDHCVELEEMLEQWAMIGAGDLDFDEGSMGGRDMDDVNIIL
ncbi:uncharacterized protein F5891DRAFT_976368 [Suillus fuscotomentosus]|uniref:DUF6532 domain-containing protein n=1 Tax=Suillus fuscotomentosus TaxID=1912939 RepID=A0AAD4EFZ5_9AGAM|nr:uncharacterized protein F5891DRAFT_976368 [Suillus fuscotomentosus]KAG1905435.1 hypothetical protein F5891DRAFT_976368 [Suillus fuscotomentosus]